MSRFSVRLWLVVLGIAALTAGEAAAQRRGAVMINPGGNWSMGIGQGGWGVYRDGSWGSPYYSGYMGYGSRYYSYPGYSWSYGYSPYRSGYYSSWYTPRYYYSSSYASPGYYPSSGYYYSSSASPGYYSSDSSGSYASGYAPGGMMMPSTGTTTNQTAQIEVRLPAPDATVKIDDRSTTSTGTERLFATPTLEPGKTFHYNLTVTWKEGDETRTRQQKVNVEAGKLTLVDFNQSPAQVTLVSRR